jgi:predicted naringenin-chalcone synthase
LLITHCLFAVHAGGPRILTEIQKCLGLKPEQLCGSWYVLQNFGNLAGSNLVLLDHIIRLRNGAISADKLTDITMPLTFTNYKHVVGLSFGPGIGVECVLFNL